MNSILRSLGLVLLLVCAATQVSAGEFLSPDAIVASDKQLFVACDTGRQVLCLDLAGHQISKIPIPLPVSGLALSRDQSILFVTCAGPESKICLIETRRLKIVRTICAGHLARAPVLSPDGGTLYVCDQFEDEVSVIGLKNGECREQGGDKRNGNGAGVRPTRAQRCDLELALRPTARFETNSHPTESLSEFLRPQRSCTFLRPRTAALRGRHS